QGDYQKWAAGKRHWNSGAVKAAWQAFDKIVTGPGQVRGGPHAALLTDFQDAGRALFSSPPGCYLDHEASVIMGFYQDNWKQSHQEPMSPGTDFDYIDFPSFAGQPGRSWEASADLAGMFRDTPQARKLMVFLASDDIQRIWADNISGAFSVNKNA